MRQTLESRQQRHHVMHVLYSLGAGGMENGVVNIANGLDGERFRTTIVCIKAKGRFTDRLAPDVEIESLDKSDGFDWQAIWRLRELIHQRQPDLLHSHNLGALMYTVLARGCWRDSPPILHGEHAELNAGETTARQRLMRRFFYRQCRALHTVSQGVTDQIENLRLYPRTIRSLHNGVDCERYVPARPDEIAGLRRERGLDPSARVIGVFGRFGDFKRHDLAIAAFERVAAAISDLVLLLVGDGGPLKAEVQAQCDASRFAERIFLAGFQADPVPWYQLTDLLLNASENEGLSNAMLEAMACATPCLVRSACGTGEVIEPGVNGKVVAMESPATVANEIEALLANRDAMVAMGNAARHTVAERFSLPAMLERYAGLYAECVG